MKERLLLTFSKSGSFSFSFFISVSPSVLKVWNKHPIYHGKFDSNRGGGGGGCLVGKIRYSKIESHARVQNKKTKNLDPY